MGGAFWCSRWFYNHPSNGHSWCPRSFEKSLIFLAFVDNYILTLTNVDNQLSPTGVGGLSLIWRWSNRSLFLPPSLLVWVKQLRLLFRKNFLNPQVDELRQWHTYTHVYSFMITSFHRLVIDMKKKRNSWTYPEDSILRGQADLESSQTVPII